MTPDQFLVLGLCLAVIAVPAIISAWSDRRAPRVGSVVLLAGLALVLHAIVNKPGGYELAALPGVLFGVIGDLIR
ncbi:hypothetical protein [Salipiger mucosus]|uniref:50S ribosomal protein L35 n=1 Tax=Salipiger mucosus DSM 16094 TaxID=1123237 RepID=S9QIJ2_9RHOB|nr:hypothetical protein [Salipiger mucosus]EPX79597.1 50S ribosomal protein L35 [Salipiger mucosus DSM 16094]